MSKFKDKHPQEIADEEGLRMVVPSQHDLFIDIDEHEPESQRARMLKGIETLTKNGAKVEIVCETESKGGNRHVYITAQVPGWDGHDPIVRCALQACLGSDPTKELLSMFRVWRHADRPPTTFFERRDDRPGIDFDADDIPW